MSGTLPPQQPHGADPHSADPHGHGDDHGSGGHGSADPNAGVVRGTPPTPAWLLTAALIGLVTILASVILAVALNDAIPSKADSEISTEGEAEPGAEAEH
ncbi:MAG TPA: hypothetical protein VNB94_12810 [Mycobacteriales bacterium]|nr:hypothetical protein [Mycobacteriales bacterium]